MRLEWRRVRAIRRKELAEFRCNRSLLAGMAIVPLLFCVQPLAQILALGASDPLLHRHVLLYLLGIPAVVPTFVAAYSVVGEREQGTLEPVLTTPVRPEELLLGKATAVLLPAVVIAYLVFAAFLACVGLFAARAVTAALLRPGDLVAQLVGTPLVAGWSTWTAMTISARVGDIRVAQQLSVLVSLPSVVVTTLIALGAVPVTTVTLAALGAALAALNAAGLRAASAVFDRERLITGRRAS